MEVLISPKETAVRAGWPERRVRQMIARKELRHIKIGNRILLPESAISEFIKQNMAAPCPARLKTQAVTAVVDIKSACKR